ncbi:CDC48 family AAA ATPase (plasmid) [Tundrisphaera lichenicola]|uniref:CDC48 family AAA ATPase n=1 Tax=Tundrisphaera lichenicola TaxID=2029860 RepID=UPI003EC042B3
MATADEVATHLKLKVSEAMPKDLGRGLARLDPADMARLGLEVGDVVEVVGKRSTVAKAMPAYKEHRGQSRVQVDGVTRENAGAAIDGSVEVRKAQAHPARRVVLAPTSITPAERDLKYIGGLLDGLPVVTGDRVRATLFGNKPADFKVTATTPPGPVVINPTTELEIGRGSAKGSPAKETSDGPRPLSYEEIGGLKRELHRIREIIELPLRYPEVFERLGISPPKGVLLHGPPGCGKTLIARAVAHETDAKFFTINGPEIIHKFYGESEAHLRKIFEEAAKQAPSIIFLDEIDAIAPQRDKVVGDVEKRVVAQLLALMDGLSRRKGVIVLAATNLPNALDPALRRPGRFDREIAISIPDRDGRKEILEIHSRGMPLAPDVDVTHLAAITHGFVGADLEALCREAAMLCLRRLLPAIDFGSGQIPYETLRALEVRMDDFEGALLEVEPSAIREVFVEIPNVGWDDVGGLEQAKRELIESVEWPLKHPEAFAAAGVKPPRGILLSGAPGCGKTLLAKAVASQTQVNFISVKGPSLLSKYVGESERGVRDIFRKAKQAAPCIIFFDEIDALVPARGSGGSDSGVTERVIGQFLAEMDGVEDMNGVLVLGATNRPDILDPALLRPGRFDIQLEIPLPNLSGRGEIFRIALREKPAAGDISIDDLASRSEGFTGAEIQGLCTTAARSALRAALEQSGGDPETMPPICITRAQLDVALDEVKGLSHRPA